MENELKIRGMDHIVIDITYDCNMSCNNCNRLSNLCKRPESNMSIDDIKKFIKESEETGNPLRSIAVSGGEPSVHPDFEKIMVLLSEYCSKNSIYLYLQTNGKTLDKINKLPDNVQINNTGKNSNNPYHYPFTIAPVDINFYYEDNNPCDTPFTCGRCLNKNGYYGCPISAAMDDILELNTGIKSIKDVNNDNLRNNTKKLCKYCSTYLVNMGLLCWGNFDYQIKSPFWKEAIEKWLEKRPKK